MRTRTEPLTPAPAAAYRGTFATSAPIPEPGEDVPAGWEGLYFPFDVPLSELRPDGSPARDGVLPEFDLPRRLYAGEDTRYHLPVRYGDLVEQRVRAGDITEKHGRSGRLVFADIVREYRVGGELAIETTWHDVFVDPAPADSSGAGSATPAGPPAPDWEPEWTEPASVDIRQLFRFSAVTFNTHRIHYDRQWAREAEGLDDLLVHGPLLRILLLDAARRHGAGTVSSWSFRSHSPVLVDEEFELRGRPVQESAGGHEVAAVSAGGRLIARGTLGAQPA